MKRELAQKTGTILLLLTVLLIFMLLPEKNAPGTDRAEAVTPTSQSAVTAKSADSVRAVWVSYIDYKSAGLYNKSEAKFTANADKLFKQLKKDGINTVYFHTVPRNDAIYPSSYLKWCDSMGPNRPVYDPMKILVQKAHRYNISFHAWINPYRKTMTSVFNPGSASSTKRILRIVKEILENYDVDGIHFDDYFYPSKVRQNQYYNVSIARRKKKVNAMVRKVYKTVKSYNRKLQFGISPAGNTSYAESIGCDLKKWLSKDGYVDYIIPQIYWSDRYIQNGKVTKLYSDTLKEWCELNKNDTPMYIGLALYKAGVKSSVDTGWTRKNNNIVSQIKLANKADCEGFVLFSSAYMKKTAASKEMKKYRAYIKTIK